MRVIVVGAGSAGSVIAARLSEDPDVEVELIEGGPDYTDLAATPFDLMNGHRNSTRDHDWGFEYFPTGNRRQSLPRGRVTGGSSAVNTTIALRGVPEDFDEWASLGCPQWGWADVLPAFNRLERDLDFGTKPYHGDAGPITIRRYRDDELLPQHAAFMASADRLGYPYAPDANDPDAWGASPHPLNKLGRVRISTAVGYLSAARIRPNLEISADTRVLRLVLEGDRACGVVVETSEGISERRADLVVLSAGALMSPMILMHSGLGPREVLESVGISCVRDVPGVGANLRDHPAVTVNARVKDSSIVDLDQPLMQTILRYTAEGSSRRNDLQIEQISYSGADSFPIAAVLEYTFGAGVLTPVDADPRTPPRIENRFCEHPTDLERLAIALRDTLAFVEDGPLADLVDEVLFPDRSRGVDMESLKSICRKRAASGYHPCGTVKMGDRADRTAVVDERGRFLNVDGLVVADASIMPTVPRANTNLTSIMIGEKVGEWLRTDRTSYV